MNLMAQRANTRQFDREGLSSARFKEWLELGAGYSATDLLCGDGVRHLIAMPDAVHGEDRERDPDERKAAQERKGR